MSPGVHRQGGRSAARFPLEGRGVTAPVLPEREGPIGQFEVQSGPIHCQEPMSLLDATPRDLRTTDQVLDSLDRARQPVLRCRCGFQMDAPYMSLSRPEPAQR